MNARIEIPAENVAEFCKRNRSFVWRCSAPFCDDFAPDSDVDVLVEFEPDARVGCFALGRMETELGDILGRKADMQTFRGIERSPNWLLREEILGSAEAVYDQAG